MTVDTKKLRELAEAATQGEWEHFAPDSDCVSLSDDQQQRLGYGFLANCDNPKTAAFIAAANPQTVIALLDTIDRMQAMSKLNGEWIDHAANVEIELRAQLAAMTRARDEACDLVESAAEFMPAHAGPSGYRSDAARLRKVGQ